MLEVKAVNKLDNGRVLVTTTNTKRPNTPQEYYSVKEENVDKFIKARKALIMADGLQKTLTATTALITGIFAGYNVKAGKLVKSAVGVLTGLGVMAGLKYIDASVDEIGKKKLLKQNEAEDITKEMTETNQLH